MMEFDAKLAFGPLVYAAFARKRCLYVGMSRVGLGRPFSNPNVVANRAKVTRIRVYTCDSVDSAFRLEMELAHRLKPLLWEKMNEVSRCAECDAKIMICRTYRGRRNLCGDCKEALGLTRSYRKE